MSGSHSSISCKQDTTWISFNIAGNLPNKYSMCSGLSCKYSLIYCHSLQASQYAWYASAMPTFKTSMNWNNSAI